MAGTESKVAGEHLSSLCDEKFECELVELPEGQDANPIIRLRFSDWQRVEFFRSLRLCHELTIRYLTTFNHSLPKSIYVFFSVTYIPNPQSGRGAQAPRQKVLRSLHVSHDHHRPWKTKKQDRVRDSTLTTLRIRIELRTERCLLARTRIRGRAPADAPKREAKIRVRFGERIAGEKHEEKISLHFFWLCKII